MNALEAWQEVLAAEHAALYGYGIVGGRLGPTNQSVHEALTAHERIRAVCIAAISESGGVPVKAAPAYNATTPDDAKAARSLAASIEGQSAYAYLQLIGNQDPVESSRQHAKERGARWLQAASQAQWRWSGQIVAWPGFED